MAKKNKGKKAKQNKVPKKLLKPEKVPPLTGPITNQGNYGGDWFDQKQDLNEPIVEGVRIDREPYLDEKIHSGVQMPYFLPYIDPLQNLNTTEEMQLAFRRMMSSPEVNAAVYNNLLAAMCLELRIHPVDKKKKQDVEVAKFVEWNLKRRVRGGVPGIMHDVLAHSAMDGMSICEKVWEIQQQQPFKGKRVLKSLKPKDILQDCVPIVDSFRNIVGIKALRYNPGSVFHPNDFLIYSRLSLFDNPLGISMLRAAYQPYWFLDSAIKIRFQAMEKRALPVIVGETDPTQQVSLQNVLSKIKSQNWIAVPRDTKIALLDIAGSSADIFEKFCRDQQTRIFLSLNGSELSSLTSGANNSRGDSSIHENTMELRTWFLSTSFCNVLNDADTGLIKDLVEGNFSGVIELPWATLAAVDEREMLAALQVDLGLKELGWIPSRDELAERYNRKIPTDPGDELSSPEEQQALLQHHTDELGKIADRKHEVNMAGAGGFGGGSNGSSNGKSGGKNIKKPSSSFGEEEKHHKEAIANRLYTGPRGGKGHITEQGKRVYENR